MESRHASGELPSYKLGRRRLISRRVLADVIACSTDAALTSCSPAFQRDADHLPDGVDELWDFFVALSSLNVDCDTAPVSEAGE